MIDFSVIDVSTIVELFLLLLIGVGPKIALVPYLGVTAGMPAATRARVTRKMLVTAGTVALILIVFGGLLTRLLHFSTGALSVAGGIILLIIAGSMVLGRGENDAETKSSSAEDPMQLAAYPLAVPYLLNPAGIVVLVTISADAASVGVFALVIVILGVVLAIDVGVFRFANRVSEQLDESRMLVTEKVFGFLLAAIAVQLVLEGLFMVGAIHLTSH